MGNRKCYTDLILMLIIFIMISNPRALETHTVTNLTQSYITISVIDAKAFTQNTTDLFILDVRSQTEYDTGYIEKALLIPHTEIQTRSDELPTNKSLPILVYCASGIRSAAASQQIDDLSYTKVYNMASGISGWKSAGYYITIPVTKAKELIDNTPNLFILDARTQTEYDDAHIEGATLVPHTEIINQTDKLPPNKAETILVYCRSGTRSANASQQLEDLGYTNVMNMANGLVNGWIPAGYPVINGTITTTPHTATTTASISTTTDTATTTASISTTTDTATTTATTDTSLSEDTSGFEIFSLIGLLAILFLRRRK